MSALIVISLSSSNLYGNIPSEIGKLSRLEFFQVSGNNLSGTIPAQLFNISSIYLFAAADNQLHGSIPSNLGNTLPNLRTLALGGNVFSGSLPSSISNVSRLSQLDFSRNRFTGDVPPNLGSLQDLVRLSLGENQLGTGEADDLIFFTSLSNCSHLEVLALTGNNLSGQLPDSIASLSTKLTKLYMGGNRVFGKIAPGIENLVSLNGLAMENNLLTGSIPVFIGKLPNLVIAAMSGNQLSGQMPSNICNSTRLEEIYCDRNRLQDQIPPNLGNCPKLRASYSFSFGENKRERLDIAIDVASALDYLHHHCQRPIVHRDLKPSNILLDNNMNGHVSDFGHAKFLGGVAISVESEYHTTSTSVGIRGAVGYAAPEYGMGREVSTNGDVYSYGILLLEMFTGRRPTDDMFKDGSSLHTFAKTSLLTNQVMQIIDPDILLVPLHLQGNDDSNNDDYNKEEELISGEMATRVVGDGNLAVDLSQTTNVQKKEMIKRCISSVTFNNQHHL
ncbi:probable LRR receptor-like serine/threonine-protein kinase At3g47570 [Papaver somniferum]|uniref:probable LRR receptor-like serine/threonine-protein kinase At3g47570 n=1 Tax=Papaver somniferum TaxID=3469 RepID=UPI000E705E73|nr:probable LRR receptor-like serine/threonine-protein kinase At3g47570 [Papaver somniferum]